MNNTKKHILKFRQTDSALFDAINTGAKKIETRAGSVKRVKIAAGEVLVFKCGSKTFQKKIKKAEHFKSLNALLKKHDYKYIEPDALSAAALKKKINGFPGYRQKIKEYGIMAFSL